MKKIIYILSIGLFLSSIFSCEEENIIKPLNYVTFETTSYDAAVPVGGGQDFSIKIYVAQATGTDRTFNFKVNTDESTADVSSYSLPNSVTIPANESFGEFVVSITDTNIGEDGVILVLEFDGVDNFFTGKELTLNISQVCPPEDGLSIAAPYIGTATVVTDDWADYEPNETVEIEAGANDNEFWIRSYANPYITNPDTSYMIVTLDDCGSATLISNEDFAYEEYCDFIVTGEGKVDLATRTVDLTLTFDAGDCDDIYTDNQFILQL